MIIDICFSPALFPSYSQPGDIVVVADIFRATTTMCMAFLNGASAIIPVATIEEAEQYKKDGYLVGAERNVKRCSFADFGNSPFEYTESKVKGEKIVFTTTNGTRAINVARNSRALLIGAFSNIDAVARKCISLGGRVVVLCAGWNDRINIEDVLFGGALSQKISSQTEVNFDSDAASIALNMWNAAKDDPIAYLRSSEHYKRLVANDLGADAKFCLQQNTVPLVPLYDKKGKICVRVD